MSYFRVLRLVRQTMNEQASNKNERKYCNVYANLPRFVSPLERRYLFSKYYHFQTAKFKVLPRISYLQ